ncbi:hypothetical protein OG435_38065 [Streptomyces sp. NBC_01264]|nr:hypothetical protein [Streptomyces sp. NBC_01264]MCX4782467.1 hypothetical protein [Streptomyces sp. NBC_01264]
MAAGDSTGSPSATVRTASRIRAGGVREATGAPIAGHAPTTVYVGHGGHLTEPSVAALKTL